MLTIVPAIRSRCGAERRTTSPPKASEAALARARAAAGDGDVAIMGGANTINQNLASGLIDELRLHIAPMTLGTGTQLFDDVPPLEQVYAKAATLVTHVTYRIVR